jgi:hypothetical protein
LTKTLDVDRKHLIRDAQIQEHPIWRRQMDWVERFIVVLRAATTPADYFQLHRALLQTFLSCQQMIERDRGEQQHARAELRAAAQAQPKNEVAVRRLSGLLEAISFHVDTGTALLSVYRTLGDALVWRLLEYNRAALAVLSDGTRVGWLSTGRGLDRELAELEYLWSERGVVAVHADITNCVRYGDLLSIESWRPRKIRLTESKAGRQGPRGRRQLEQLDRIDTVINDGFHPLGDRGEPLAIAQCRVRFETHLRRIREVLSAAKLQSRAAAELEPGLLVEAYDSRDPAGMAPADFGAMNEQDMANRGWHEHDLLRYSTHFRRLRDQRETFGMQLPLALLPFPADDVVGLLMGPLDYMATLNAAVVEERLSDEDVRVEIARGTEAANWFVRAERGAQRITLPSPALDQVLLEGLTIDSLGERIRWFLDDTEQRAGRNSVAVQFVGERDVWEPVSGLT